MPLSGSGVDVTVPAGWDGRIAGRRPEGDLPPGEVAAAADAPTTAVVHVASFPLPPDLGDFGSGAVDRMTNRDVFVAIFEYGRESATQPLFATQGVPRFRGADFSPSTLRTMIPGQSGVQRFFSVNGRAFCIYAVLGSHTRRVGLAGLVNDVVASLRIS